MTRIGIFAGLSTIDIIHNVTDFPARNKKVTAQSQEVIVGGPATNAAITFAFLGGSAKLIAPVGCHAIADLIEDECGRFGVELFDLTPDSDAPPPISSVWVNRHGERSVVSVNTGLTSIASVDVDSLLLDVADVLMVDGHAMQAGQAWAKAAKSAGVRVVFDGGSWKPGTDELLKCVDTAICSADFRPPGCASDEDVIAFLCASGVAEVAITHGADPVRFFSRNSNGAIEVPTVEAVDTAGAGDIFHGAFCFYSARGREFEGALREAAKTASDSCRYPGTRRWMYSAGFASFGSRPQVG